MSIEALLWAIHDSPVKDTTERLILTALADKANADGTDAYPSRNTISSVALCDVKTAQRKLKQLRERGVISLGDQEAARRIPAHLRPRVYDMEIPASWYGTERLTRVNLDREHRGLPPLTPENRPDLAAPPERATRADKGKPRTPKKKGGLTVPPTSTGGGGDSQSREGGLTVPGGGTTSPQRGDSQSPNPSYNPATNPSIPPQAVSEPKSEGGTAKRNGRTEGGTPRGTNRTPGNDLLLTIGAQHPEFAVYGKVLRDQSLVVDELLQEGWTRAQIRQAITGRPLPKEISTSVAAIMASRLRDAAESGPPMGAIPGPATPTPARYGEHNTPDRSECQEVTPDGLTCRAVIPYGSTTCRDCAESPTCACGQRRYDPRFGTTCQACELAPDPHPLCDGCQQALPEPGEELCGRCKVTTRKRRPGARRTKDATKA